MTGAAVGGEAPSLDERAVVDALRGQALELTSEMLGGLAAVGATGPVAATSTTELYATLVTLVMRAAVRVAASARGLVPRGGRLFDDGAHPLVADRAFQRAVAPPLARAERALAAVEVGGERVPVPWAELPPDVVGALYEGLIGRGVERAAGGSLVLSQSSGKKQSGSYYTPRAVAREVAARALAPAFARIAALPAAERVDALLALTLCDPALGAGAFLLESARQLAAQIPPTALEPLAARRAVVTRTLFGCDSSPLAVAVAEATLWLFISDGALPLDAAGVGLRTGDALVGLLYDELARLTLGPTSDDDGDLFGATTAAAGAAVRVSAEPDRLRRAADHVVGSALVGAGRRAAAQVRAEALTLLAGGPSVSATATAAAAAGAFHWGLELTPTAGPVGFDVVIGNPPWVAFAGRAAQPLAPALRAYHGATYAAWRGYPTLHGLFVERAARLAPRGVVALLVPSPLADLDGYRAVRAALTRTHVPREPLLEFGQDAFAAVVQPCFALVADPDPAASASDRPWVLEERQRAGAVAARVERPAVLDGLANAAPWPPELFREMGFQTTAEVSRTLLLRADAPDAEHQVPLLEGRNVREFFVGEPRLFLAAAPERLRAARARLRPVADYRAVAFVVRQTAAIPIAARHTGLPFRNTLIAGLPTDELGVDLVVGLLNSALYRALHVAAQRDARQAAFPQVKVAHLRRLPLPPPDATARGHVAALAQALAASAASHAGAIERSLRDQLDEAVFTLFRVGVPEREGVRAFLAERVGAGY